MDKKKITIILIIISILLVGSAIATSTYALFYNEKVAANPNEYSTGLLSIEAVSKSDIISLDNVLPMDDSEGIETDAYTFTIKNIGNLDYTFDVKLLSTSSNTIDPNYIKLKIDDAEVTTLSSLTNSIIKNNLTLRAKESIDISIKIWLDINTPNSQIGKEFTSNLVIDGVAIYTETNENPYYGAFATIYDLFEPNSTVVNNSITYEIDTVHSLIKDTMGNIRYYGANPDNYIYFNCETYPDTNCETWRIIGIVDGKLKLMRGLSIGYLPWDTSENTTFGNSGEGINQWGESTYTTDDSVYQGADLMKLLNPGYETNQDLNNNGATITVNNSLYYNSRSGSCYNKAQNSSVTCDFTNTGIKNDATRNKIVETIYYNGGWNNASVYPNIIIEKERGTGVGSNKNDKVLRTTKWTGRVSVPYPSDYAYASDLSTCTGKNLSQYNDSTCTANNWIKDIITNNGNDGGWFISPFYGFANGAFCIGKTGSFSAGCKTSSPLRIVPVLHLTPGNAIDSGSGTSADPYRLSA